MVFGSGSPDQSTPSAIRSGGMSGKQSLRQHPHPLQPQKGQTMKLTIVLAAASLTAFSIAATPAAAWKLSPSGDFTADGTTSATKNGVTLPCKAHFTGTVN